MAATARAFRHYYSARKLSLFALEWVALFLAAAAGARLAAEPAVLGARADLALGLLLVACVQLCLYFSDLYDLKAAELDRASGGRLLLAGGAALVLLAILVSPALSVLPRGAAIGAAGGAVVAAFAVRRAFPRLIGRPIRVLLFGTGERARDLARDIAREATGACELLGFVDPHGAGAASAMPRVHAGPVDQLCERLGADVLVIACEEHRGALPAEALMRARLAGRAVLASPAFCERVLRRLPVGQLRESDLIFSDDLGRRRARTKRALDVSTALILALLAAPVMLVVAILIRLDSPGPVFYRQGRVGLGGKPFWLAKFRTMRVDAEAATGPVWAQAQDERVTRLGRVLRRCRIDELPQLFAVLRGDMSMVGPRPERPFFVEQLEAQIPFYGLREAVKPGVTGWAQLCYPYGASVDDARAKLEYDLYYVKNGSLFLDLSILFHTVRHVLLGRGAR